MIQEFDLSVTPVGNSQYLIRTEQVPYGAPLAQEQVTWAVDHWLEQARQLMGDPVRGVLQASPIDPASGRSALNLIELGQELFAALFRETLRDSWVIAQGVAQSHREPLRLRLGLKGPNLPRLPWEVMYGTDVPVERLRQGSITAAPQPLATGTRIIFSRYQIGPRLVEDVPALPPDQPLRILMVVSAPNDREQLKLYREVQQMQQELQDASNENGETVKIQLKTLNQPGREELARTLEQGQFQVLHYAGHSDLSAAGGSLYLVNSRTGLTEILTGDDLAGLLVNNGIRLALFNSCRGAHTAASNPTSGQDRNLAEALVSRGIPAVLAMAEQIPDNVAQNLTIWFYRNLKLGFPIDMSLNRARQALVAAYSSNQFYWALPVLYLHPDFDGCLIARDRATIDGGLNRMPTYGSSGRLPRLEPSQPPARSAPPMGELNLSGHLAERPSERQPVRSAEQPMTGSKSSAADLDLSETDSLEETTDTEQQSIAQMLEQLTPPVASSTPAKPAPAQPKPAEAGVPTASSVAPALVPTDAPTHAPVQPVVRPQKPRPASSGRVRRFLLLPVLGAIGLGAYAAFYGIPHQGWQLPGELGRWMSTDAVAPAVPTIDSTASVEELRALAQDYFKNQQPEPGLEAVKLLLEKGALSEASEAIAAAPANLKDDARINFLRGRLAWQGMKAKDGIHTLEQALGFWESAVDADPDRSEYQQALMFAYYTSGDAKNLERAIQSWFNANNNPSLSDDEVLNFKALAALVLQKRAAAQPDGQRKDYLLNAVLLYEETMRRAPQRFNPEALERNWLWTDAAIKDWQALNQLANPADQQPAAQSSPSISSPPSSPSPGSASPQASPASPQPSASASVPPVLPAASP